MLEMKNGFAETDSDCMQCRKDLGNREFLFIQVISSDEEGKYFVVANKEDLKEMSLNDIKTAVSGYYDGILGMEQTYNLPLGQLDDIVAKCSFESRRFLYKHESEAVTWTRAENIIQCFINIRGMLFREK
jgi:hypothetical protein